MPSISPVHEIIEPGSKDFGPNFDLMTWNGAPKYPSDAECKTLPISGFVNLLANEPIIPAEYDSRNTDYTTECGYPSNMTNNFWENEHPRNWNCNQVIDWLYYAVFYQDFESVHIESLRGITGKELIQMKKADFIQLLRNDSCAERVYSQVQQLLYQFDYMSNNPSNLQNVINNISYETNNGNYPYINDVYTNLEQTRNPNYNGCQYSSDAWCNVSRSDVESDSECNRSPYASSPYPDIMTKHADDIPHRPSKRGPGRPAGRDGKKKKTGQRSSRLWEFIRDLLKNKDTCPRLVKWEDREEGVFRFVQSDQVAKLWGERKSNPRMTYEKLSRAMRYYYKSKVLQPVLGRRLVYKFGPTATGWRPHEV